SGNTPGIGAKLPTYRLTTRNSALMAAWLVVIEYRLHTASGLRIRMAGPRPQLQQLGWWSAPGLSTLAAAEAARQVVDEGGGWMSQRGHVDVPLGPAARALDLNPWIAPVQGLVDRGGWVDRLAVGPHSLVPGLAQQLVSCP